tara:strand:+ start:1489 stop:1698 length:210 start_codon:yes stop_codon:yes gene_type:complete
MTTNELHSTTLRFPVDLIAALKGQAAIENLSMTRLIEEFCREGLQERGQSNEKRIEDFRKLVKATGSIG